MSVCSAAILGERSRFCTDAGDGFRIIPFTDWEGFQRTALGSHFQNEILSGKQAFRAFSIFDVGIVSKTTRTSRACSAGSELCSLAAMA